MTVAGRRPEGAGAAVRPRGVRRGASLAGALALLSLFPLSLPAQHPSAAAPAPAAARGLTLEDALRAALQRGALVRAARERVAASAGSARAASGPFDVQMRTFVGSSRDQTLRFDGAGAPAVDPSHTTGVTYGATVDKRFRSGIVVGPELRAERVGSTPDVESRNNTASAALVVQVPLAQGRGVAVNAAPERAAVRDLGASRDALVHAGAQSVLATALAYWEYAAARERLEVQKLAEQRARKLVEETRVLVEAEERPAADLNQLRANLATKEAARIAAEQDLVAAREALGLQMGLPGDAIAALPPPATPFPAAREDDLRGGIDALVQAALERRSDLRSARGQSESAALLERAARDGTRPRVDLSLRVGYTGAEPGRGFADMFEPFYRSMAGWSASMELSWQAWSRNARARGEAERSGAVLRERQVAADELAREIRSGVVVAAEALRHGRLELERAEEAVRLYRLVVDAEERKFGLGMSTLFDVIQAENELTSAMSASTSARARYAAALVRLAFATGTLVSGDGGEMALDLRGLGTPAPPAP